MQHYPSISLDEASAYLEKLNLEYIVDAMCAETYALPRWEKSDAMHCVKLYKNFLFLQKKYPLEQFVPTRQIDEFWHNHILSTKKYHHDCLHIFGHYLHHEPASASDDHQSLIKHFLKTQQLYAQEFGESL